MRGVAMNHPELCQVEPFGLRLHATVGIDPDTRASVTACGMIVAEEKRKEWPDLDLKVCRFCVSAIERAS